MLFLNTLQVEAGYNTLSPGNSTTTSLSFKYSPDTNRWAIVSGSGYVSNGTGSVSVSSYNTGIDQGTYHFKVPFSAIVDYSGTPVSNQMYAILFILTAISSDKGSVSNAFVTSKDGQLISKLTDGNFSYYYLYGSQFTNGNIGGHMAYYDAFLEFDLSYTGTTTGTSEQSVTINMTYVNWLYSITDDIVESNKVQVIDSKSAEYLSIQNQISTATNNKLDTQISQENTAQNTRTGILGAIQSFFGSFFQNFVDKLKALFIPSNDYFTTWFSNLNNLLSQKLGMLYAPFSLVISVLTAIMNADSTESGIPFPGIKWENTWIVEPQTFYFSSLGSQFNDLREAVYFGTDVVLLFAFLVLLQRKINLVLRGNETD